MKYLNIIPLLIISYFLINSENKTYKERNYEVIKNNVHIKQLKNYDRKIINICVKEIRSNCDSRFIRYNSDLLFFLQGSPLTTQEDLITCYLNKSKTNKKCTFFYSYLENQTCFQDIKKNCFNKKNNQYDLCISYYKKVLNPDCLKKVKERECLLDFKNRNRARDEGIENCITS